jgi:hypothetical protein
MTAKERRSPVRHLVEHLQVNVRDYRRAALFLCVFKEEDMIHNLRLPVHEFLNFVELWSGKLNYNPGCKIECLFVLKHLWKTDPVHQPQQGIIVKCFFPNFDDLYHQ